MTAPKLTPAQRRALTFAIEHRQGVLVAGNDEHRGSRVYVPAPAILALVRRGLAELTTGETTTARITPAGRAALDGAS